ncbi:hypothetical protein ACFJIV_12575 [Mucilaginibacter sp. UC70_90]
MSHQQSPVPGRVNTQQHSTAGAADFFLFDLKNEASEHGFKADESWTLELSTDEEIAGLKRHYYPVISTRLKPAALLEVFQVVKQRLQQALSISELALTENDIARNEKKHLAAFPSKLSRK